MFNVLNKPEVVLKALFKTYNEYWKSLNVDQKVEVKLDIDDNEYEIIMSNLNALAEKYKADIEVAANVFLLCKILDERLDEQD